MKNITVTATQEKAKRNMMNTTKYKDVMQCLHVLNGFDFCKDYTLLEVSGKITYNNVMSIIQKQDDMNIIVLIVGVKYGNEQVLYYAKPQNGRFNRFDNTVINYYRAVHDAYGVGDLEYIRKKSNKAYIIIQENKYYIEPKYRDWDYNEREKYNDGCNNNKNKIFRSVKPRYKDAYDKSGYIISSVREEYRRRVKALKAEREKAKADKYDVQAVTEEIGRKIKHITDKCATMLAQPDVEKIVAINNISWHLRSLYLTYQDYRFGTEHNQYASIYAIQNEIDWMNDRIAIINNTLDRI